MFNLFNRLRWDDPEELEIDKLTKDVKERRKKVPEQDKEKMLQLVFMNTLVELERNVNSFLKTAIITGMITKEQDLRDIAKMCEKTIAESAEWFNTDQNKKEHMKAYLPNSLALMLASWKSHRDEFSNLLK